jgi:2-haloacid dehalogenase
MAAARERELMPPTAVFDANGTLFALDPVQELLGAAATEAFFQRALHSAAALTYAGVWAPFDEVARRALETTCAQLGLDVDQEAVLRALQELPPAPGAREAVDAAGDCAVLTNGGRESIRKLVERAGLPIARILSCEDVRAYKPSRAPYEYARAELGDCVLIAAHGWDVVGARAAGLRAVWVSRNERAWPLAGVAPGEQAPTLLAGVLGL